MILAKVVGDITSTSKIPPYKNRKILIVQPLDIEESPVKKTFLALDTVQAGIGDQVIIIDEGGSAQMVLGDTNGTIRTVIVGIVDEVHTYE
jgi:microcompartment protein CcmK/EutM